jgi:hypothetical protein
MKDFVWDAFISKSVFGVPRADKGNQLQVL